MSSLSGGKINPKLQQIIKNGFSSEVLKDSQPTSVPKSENKPLFSLKGILSLGQTAEISKSKDSLENKTEKVFYGINHLDAESKHLFSQNQEQLEKNIQELKQEIKQLIKATDQLEKQVEVAAESPVVEYTEYQLKFFDRIRSFISKFRQNISQAGNWLESFNKRKRKRTIFGQWPKTEKRVVNNICSATNTPPPEA